LSRLINRLKTVSIAGLNCQLQDNFFIRTKEATNNAVLHC